jgi:hypothetical protein
MSIEQEIDTKIKQWIGDLTVQNIARQAKIDELTAQLAQAQQQIAQQGEPSMFDAPQPRVQANGRSEPSGH